MTHQQIQVLAHWGVWMVLVVVQHTLTLWATELVGAMDPPWHFMKSLLSIFSSLARILLGLLCILLVGYTVGMLHDIRSIRIGKYHIELVDDE